MNWFPFELRLEWNLCVNIQGHNKSAVRLMERVGKHEGWCFQIRGNYNSDEAKRAVQNMKGVAGRVLIPPNIGLRAAATF
jgi:hypothetical protein